MATTTSGVRLSDDAGVVWPRSPYEHAANDVPIVFFGHGVDPGRLPDGIGVDRIAPTLARVMGYDRPHSEIRSGVAVAEAVHAGARPPLVVEIVWRGRRHCGVRTLRASLAGRPRPARCLDVHRDDGLAPGRPGRDPHDDRDRRACLRSTASPRRSIRDAQGRPVPAWSAAAPTSIVATLGDDWDHATAERARIGLVARSPVDRGLIGGTWFLSHDRDDVAVGSADPARAVGRLARCRVRSRRTTDILGVVLGGTARTDGS